MLNIKNIFVLLSLMFLVQINLFGQKSMTIDSVLKAVETNNPSLKIYDEQVKQQDALIESASAWKAPMLGIGSFMTPYNNFSRANNLRDGSFMLTAEQEILNKSKKNSEAAYLAAQSVITLAAKNNNLNELKALARSFFYDVVVEQKKVELINKNIEILSNLKKLANIRYTYNKADLDQIYSLDAKIYDGQNKLTAALANIHIGKIRLNVLMNKPYNAPISIDTSLNIVHFVIKDINSMVANRSIVKQADAQIQSVNLAKKMIANEAKPDFNISFNHMLAYNNQMPNQFSLMAGVSIPIAPWAAKGYKSKLKANEFESNALRLERDNLVNQLNGMIKSSEQHLLHLNSELETYKNKILPSLNKSYEVMMLNYQENKKELSEVLTGWKDLNDAQIDYLNLYNEYFKMYVEYEKNVER
ncbi:TolC family protein [Pedobacter alpinus]